MTKVAQDFEIWAGEDKEVTYTVTDSSGASKNLTGASVYWIMANDPKAASLVRKETGGSGVTISGCTFTVALYETDTSALAGRYFTEARVRDSAGSADTVATGWIKINDSLV